MTADLDAFWKPFTAHRPPRLPSHRQGRLSGAPADQAQTAELDVAPTGLACGEGAHTLRNEAKPIDPTVDTWRTALRRVA